MSDRERAIVTVIGGALALLIAVLSSLAIGPGPIFTFDKVVVGALLVGGLGAFGVAINIGQSPQARAAREMANAPKAAARYIGPSDFDRLAERIGRVERETMTDTKSPPTEPPVPSFEKVGGASSIPTSGEGGKATRPVAAGGPDF